MINLFYDCYQVLSKVYSDGAFLKRAILETPLEPLNKQKTIKICYGVLDNDGYLDYALSCFYDKPPKQKIRILLKIGEYAISFLDAKPFAVIDNIVELTKKLGKGANAGFVNAVLRKSVGKQIPLPTDELKYLSVKYSYPEFAVKLLLDYYGREKAEKIMAFDDEFTFVRFKDGSGEEYLEKLKLPFEKTPYDKLFSAPKMKLEEGFYDGLYTFQSIGSVAICSALSGGDSLLDACAAPGGKSVLLSEKFKRVVACELHEHRVELIKKYAERMKRDNVEPRLADATVFNAEFENAFDAVLCDVPCSGYGTVKQNPDLKLKKSVETVRELSALQLKILKNVSKYVKTGGELLYSTCSVFKEENDDVVKSFLAESNGFEIDKISCPLNGIETDYGLQLTPDSSMGAGFYMAKLKRVK